MHKEVTSQSAREAAFTLTDRLEQPLDMMSHLPFRVAVVSNLLALNRDWKVRELCHLEPREMRVLLNIGSYMPIKAADLAYQSRLDSYTISRAVKKLLNQGLIEAQPDLQSKNIKYLVLNDAGSQLYRQLQGALESRSAELESVLSQDEVMQLYEMLSKIELKAEQLLAKQAIDLIEQGKEPAADQKELIRWYRRGEK